MRRRSAHAPAEPCWTGPGRTRHQGQCRLDHRAAFFGVLVATDDDERARRTVRLSVVEAMFDPLPVTVEVARVWGQLVAAVAVRGGNPRRRQIDLAIAATAQVEGVPLLTEEMGLSAGPARRNARRVPRCVGCGGQVSEWAYACPVCRTPLAPEAAGRPGEVLHGTGGAVRDPGVGGRRHRAVRLLVGAAALVAAVVAALVALVVVDPLARSSPRVLPGRVISLGGRSVLVSRADGSNPQPLGGSGGIDGLVASPQGQLAVLSAGRVRSGRLSGDAFVPAGPPVVLPGNGRWFLGGFADHGNDLVAFGRPVPGVAIADLTTGSLRLLPAAADSVVGDPATGGVFLAVPAPARSRPGVILGTVVDAGVVVDDVGHRPRTVIRSPQIAADLGEAAATPLQLTVTPNVSGSEIAIIATSALIHDHDSLSGLVVVDRAGRLLGSINPAEGVGGQVAWSPDGTSLVYVTSRAGRAVIARWTGGYAVTLTDLPEPTPPPAQLDDPCLWSTSNAGYLCYLLDPDEGKRSIWVSADPHGHQLRTAPSDQDPLAWIG